MIRNRELVSRSKQFARDSGGNDRDRVLAMIDQYEVACDLSLGPDQSRCKAWESKARERRNALCNAVGYSE